MAAGAFLLSRGEFSLGERRLSEGSCQADEWRLNYLQQLSAGGSGTQQQWQQGACGQPIECIGQLCGSARHKPSADEDAVAAEVCDRQDSEGLREREREKANL